MAEIREKEFEERVIQIDRIARVVAGGRRIRFRATVVVGNGAGKVGMGVAKASEVILAVQKAINHAKKYMITVPIVNETIPFEIEQSFGAARVLLKPATKGTGIIAGGAVRVAANLAGIKNLLAKILGSSSKINTLHATMEAFTNLEKMAKKFQIEQKPFIDERNNPDQKLPETKTVVKKDKVKKEKKLDKTTEKKK